MEPPHDWIKVVIRGMGIVAYSDGLEFAQTVAFQWIDWGYHPIIEINFPE